MFKLGQADQPRDLNYCPNELFFNNASCYKLNTEYLPPSLSISLPLEIWPQARKKENSTWAHCLKAVFFSILDMEKEKFDVPRKILSVHHCGSHAVNKQDRKTLSKTFLPAKSKLKRSNMLHIMAHWFHIISQLKVCDITRIKMISIETNTENIKNPHYSLMNRRIEAKSMMGLLYLLTLPSPLLPITRQLKGILSIASHIFSRGSPQ